MLNHVFADWREIADADWATATPGRVERRCLRYDAIAAAFDSYHFFLHFVPWCAATAVGCGKAADCDSRDTCAAHHAATAAWWAAFHRLPSAPRDACAAAFGGAGPPPCALD